MHDSKTINEIINIIKNYVGSVKCALDYTDSFTLLIAVMLSAQCTDARVNIVTKQLFAVADTPQKMQQMPLQQLENILKPLGLYKAKARNCKSIACDLNANFNGVVPDGFKALTSLKGVGQKTALVVQNLAFNKPTIAVDTHVKRVSVRLGLANSDKVSTIQQQLSDNVNNALKRECHNVLIAFGRKCCTARSPKCAYCVVKNYCFYIKNN